jgi:hypothetical protein
LSENNFENNHKKKSKKNKKCKIKCMRCEFYDPLIDYCNEKDIEDCSKQSNANFSSCDSFLIREDLVMF